MWLHRPSTCVMSRVLTTLRYRAEVTFREGSCQAERVGKASSFFFRRFDIRV
jgi:hypothetical protein